MRYLIKVGLAGLVGVVLALSAAPGYSGVGVWDVQDGVHVGQGNAGQCTEILPGEDMDGVHVITWWPNVGGGLNGGVRFFPSWSWNNPAAGDMLCFLYDSPTFIVWWQGTFLNPSQEVVVQLMNCDNNDGWVDVYVDGLFEFAYNSFHNVSTNVRLVGTGFGNFAHIVDLQTHLSGGDVSIDYVAGGSAASAADPSTWGSIKALFK
jgi:hypothetical protein